MSPSDKKNGSFIVSRNYLDRKAPQQWLARSGSEHPKAAQRFKSIVATGVRFGPSTEYEYGFGCSTVAHCDSVSTSNRRNGKPEGVRLVFNSGNGCFYNPDRSPVIVCDKLTLCSDGSMYAVGGDAMPKDAKVREPEHA